jgi:hypothetical protein
MPLQVGRVIGGMDGTAREHGIFVGSTTLQRLAGSASPEVTFGRWRDRTGDQVRTVVGPHTDHIRVAQAMSGVRDQRQHMLRVGGSSTDGVQDGRYGDPFRFRLRHPSLRDCQLSPQPCMLGA